MQQEPSCLSAHIGSTLCGTHSAQQLDTFGTFSKAWESTKFPLHSAQWLCQKMIPNENISDLIVSFWGVCYILASHISTHLGSQFTVPFILTSAEDKKGITIQVCFQKMKFLCH